MLGPEDTAERVTAWLAPRLPDRLDAIAVRRGDAPGTIGAPARVLSHDRTTLALEDYPAVLVMPQLMRSATPLESTDAGMLYLCTYDVRVEWWVRGATDEAVDTLRRRYALAIRELLLERQSLTVRGDATAGAFAVVPTTVRESYSDVLTDDVSTLASGALNVDVRVAEELLTDTGPRPVLTAIDQAVRPLPKVHPGAL
jgi:hypothetical protein